MAAHPCCTEGTWKRSAAPRVDRPVYPRRAEHNTVAEGGNRRWAEIARRPVVLVELADDPEDRVRDAATRRGATCSLPPARWRGESKPGKSEPFPCRFAASAQPSQPVRREIRQSCSHPGRALRATPIGPRTDTTGLAGVSPHPGSRSKRASCTAWMPSPRGGGWANGRHGPGCRGIGHRPRDGPCCGDPTLQPRQGRARAA
jgi:hypothetical protein